MYGKGSIKEEKGNNCHKMVWGTAQYGAGTWIGSC
jgi:hypothetical protein